MIKKYWKIIIIIVVVIILAGLYYNFKYNNNAETAQTTIDPRMVMEVERGNLQKTIAAEGFIKAINKENLSFPSRSSGSTKIKRIYVEEGEMVEEGQLLIELDKTEARLNCLQKQNNYNRAKINGSRSEIEEARINLELAESELENLELKAPFSGIITDIYIEEGNYFSSGTAATIKDTGRLEVEINIEESNIPAVKLGQPVKASLPSLPGIELDGEVSEIGNEADNNNAIVTLPVTVLLEKIDYDVKLGCSAELDIIVGEVKNKIIIPITAVVNRGNKDFVVKVNDEKTEEIPVKTGMSNGLKIVIESGLEPGDKILTNTFQQAPGYGENTGREFRGSVMMGGRS